MVIDVWSLERKIFPLFGFTERKVPKYVPSDKIEDYKNDKDIEREPEIIIYSFLRKKGDDGKWYLIPFVRTYRGEHNHSNQIIYLLISEIYAFMLLGIVDTKGQLKSVFNNDLIHKVDKELQEEEGDRIGAIVSYLTIDEFKKLKKT